MAKRPRAELDEYAFPAPDDYYKSRRLKAKGENLALPSLLMLGTIAIAWMIISDIQVPVSIKQVLGLETTPENRMSEAFRLAVNKAMLAANLTQTAQYREEWQKVATLWEESVTMMKQVPEHSDQHAIAQEKVLEYGRNLEYAQSHVRSRPSGAPITNQVWSAGATREFLLAVQGLPTEIQRNNTLCTETYYYGASKVELDHGIVSNHKNHDNNLNATPPPGPSSHVAQPAIGSKTWGLGATEETILRIQGTPTQVRRYGSLEMDIFYYDGNIVQLRNGIVIGYSNFDGTLLANMDAMVPKLGQGAVPSVSTVPPEANVWSIGSARSDVFRVQGTPSQITRSNVGCKEVLHYDGSTIDLQNGIVQEYNNMGNNLKVRLTNVPPPQKSL